MGKKDTDVMDENWKNLLDSSTNLNVGHFSTPRIIKSLKGIEAEAHRLSSRTNKSVSTQQLKAFAAKAGVSIQNQKEYMHTIASVPTIDENTKSEKVISQKPVHPTNTMDLHNFLKEHRSYILESTIEECKKLSSITVRRKYEISIEEDWDNEKSDILEYLEDNGMSNANDHIPQQQDFSLLDYPRFIQQKRLQQMMQSTLNINKDSS